MTEHSFIERRYIGLLRDALHAEGFVVAYESFKDDSRTYLALVRKGTWSGEVSLKFEKEFRTARQFQDELSVVINRMVTLAHDAVYESDMA